MKRSFYCLSQSLDTSYENLKASTFAVLINATFVYVVLHGSFDGFVLELWYGSSAAIVLTRFWLSYFYKRNTNRLTLQEWEYIFIIGVFFGALIWGSATFLLFDEENIINQLFLLFVIAGMSAGSIALLSSHIPSVRLFLLMTLVPLIIKCFLMEQEIYYYMAMLVVLFLLMLLKIADIFHKNQMRYLHTQSDLKLTNNYLRGLIENAPVGIFTYDNTMKITEINGEFAKMFDAPQSYLVGLDLKTLPDKRVVPALESVFGGVSGFYEGEYITKLKSLQKWVRLYTSPILDADSNLHGGLGILLDITERIKVEQRFEYQAKYDSLTNIPNRYTLMERLGTELARYHKYKIIFAVAFLDLDHFKNINDSYGHTTGDALIASIAKRIEGAIRGVDVVARLGGDEFVLLLSDLSKNEREAAIKAESMVERVVAALRKPFVVEDHEFEITLSVGIALASQEDMSADDILKHADMAIYKAKKDGRNAIRFYESYMDGYVQRRMSIENDLKNALKNREFELYFQPIVSIESLKVAGAEALLRWRDHAITPAEFIPIAEESGLIISIGNWVLENSIKEFKRWQEEGLEIEKVAINISINQFMEAGFVTRLQNLIEIYNVPAESIELELTESVIIKDFEYSRAKMKALREIGFSISIDDFGTGYSSLSYLKHLPFTTLKIDKSFTSDILRNKDDKELVSTMITIAKNFDMEVVAEGVEESAQLNYLIEKRSTHYQGYLCSKPMNGDDFVRFIQNCTATNHNCKECAQRL
ncbi:MAG: EAL domain-containing protein [Epsilonproteobacteria bacterium]|nr:EAL domain-containing protein [Campylobacterota bacterium]